MLSFCTFPRDYTLDLTPRPELRLSSEGTLLNEGTGGYSIGKAVVGTSAPIIFTIRNAGDADLEVQEIEIVAPQSRSWGEQIASVLRCVRSGSAATW